MTAPEPESGSPEAVEQAPRHTPGPWERIGGTVFVLMHAGWHGGEESKKNRFTVSVYGDLECPRDEVEANAALIARAWEIPELERQRDELAERVRELEDSLEFSKTQVTDLVTWKNRLEQENAAEEERLQKQIVVLGEINRELADALEAVKEWGLRKSLTEPHGPLEGIAAEVMKQVREALRKAGRS